MTQDTMAMKGTSCWSPNYEWIDGLLYRKKLERGFLNFREVLDEDRRLEAIATFHRRSNGKRHLSLEETYKCVADNYWWDGMYFQIRDFVLDCPECRSHHCKREKQGGQGCVTKTMASHSSDMLRKLKSQREAGMFCDITLRTNGRSYAAHRAVLAAVSDHFQEIFTEMDSSIKADIDLTGFSEDSLLCLLDFSYSSTLCVRQEDLPEVITMARHLGMWPAVEACSALMKEHHHVPHPSRDFKLAYGVVCGQQIETKREPKDNTGGFWRTLNTSDESLDGSPSCNSNGTPDARVKNGLPVSPSHRMKLMDFKSPSSKKRAASRNLLGTPQSKSYSPLAPSNTRLLRSSPGAAQKVQRLLPTQESPRGNRKSRTPISSPICSPVRVKEEVEEVQVDEEDYARAQEKYKLMLVLGLQRTALLPRPEDLIGWRQKKRLRKLKANNYSLTKRRKPRSVPPVLPYRPVTLSLPLCDPVNNLLNKTMKTKSDAPPIVEGIRKRHNPNKQVPPSDRSMRSQGILPNIFQATTQSVFSGRELRRSVRNGVGVPPPPPPPQQPQRRSANKTPANNTFRIKPEPAEYSVSGHCLASNNQTSQRTCARNTVKAVKTLRYNSGRPGTKAKPKQGSGRDQAKPSRGRPRKVLREETNADKQVKTDHPGCGFQFSERSSPPAIYNHPLYKVIKEEPADPVPVGSALFLDPPSPDLGKRQSKPPIKLLDSGFLFSFCRPSGATMGIKKEEESVDICLTRSVSQVRDKFGRGKGSLAALTIVKRERVEKNVTQTPKNNHRDSVPMVRSRRSTATRITPKQEPSAIPVSGRTHAVVDSVRRARLKQLRGPRSQAPKAPRAAHSCAECAVSYRDCDTLIMHRLRHIEGKHWPCLLCSKTFFRLRNVRNHIRTHDPKLYKCRSCIAAGS